IRRQPPGDRDRLREQVRLAGVQGFNRFTADLEPLIVAVPREFLGIVPVWPAAHISGDKNPLGRADIVRRIDDILVGAVGPGETPEDVVVSFPEAWRLEAYLHAGKVGDALERSLLGGGEVVGNSL